VGGEVPPGLKEEKMRAPMWFAFVERNKVDGQALERNQREDSGKAKSWKGIADVGLFGEGKL